MSDPFLSLGPELILNTIDSLGFSTDGRFMSLNSLENRVFAVGLEDSSRVVAKFYRPGRWGEEAIREEHRILLRLEEEEIPVLSPWRDEDGNSLFFKNGFWIAIWPLMPGRIVEEWQTGDWEQLGRLLGRFHSVAQQLELTERPAFDSDLFQSFLSKIEEKIESNITYTKYKAIYDEIVGSYQEKCRIYGIPFQAIHGDCHKGNVLRSNSGTLALIDFDDCLKGPALQDFWMLLPEETEEFSLFLDSYSNFASFDFSWKAIRSELQALRIIQYSSWIVRRWEDESFPKLFPDFGTAIYWEREITHLTTLLTGGDII